MTLVDSDQRQQATCPRSSFIVQAPAGSGKTEILTQRYLRLLGTVKNPEQIIALTFTRKAASEMRERIVLALHQANSNTLPSSPHQQQTLNYAKQALAQDNEYQWQIVQQPNRLKIITIDSLCQSINQSIPLLEKQIAYAQITDKANSHYLNAARQCIQYALETPTYQGAIQTLLLHLDNRQDRLIGLFKDLLAQRDQWLLPLFQARDQDKASFEQGLRFIEEHELNRCCKSLPLCLKTKITDLTRELARIENNPLSPRYVLTSWHDFNQIDQQIAQGLCKALLGSDFDFRNSFDHHVGLKKDSCSPSDFRRLKEESKILLAELSDYPDFLAALIRCSTLPNPEYNLEQWEVLQALFLLLPLLASHLHLQFVAHDEVDFTAISQQALHALGTSDQPTDLALYLDHGIHHLLVDEFQDTSIGQFALITQLVQGWEPGDGRTLFVVGDPMQSIYRFRQAEVGLFYRAKEQGIGPVQLTSLELRCNFRATPTVIDWVNTHFKTIFPQDVDIESGAVSFYPSVHVTDQDELDGVQAYHFASKEEEAKQLLAIIKHEMEGKPEQTVAILVRSRTQLPAIINLLRAEQLPYQGTDIDLLAHLPHLRDVWSLTEALLAPGNRLSWLALLRSPYCGLSLKDLHTIAQFSPKRSVYYALSCLAQIQGLTEEGRIRAHYFFQIMNDALTDRYQQGLADWVSQTLKKLQVEVILTPTALNDLQQFWTLLDRYEHQGRLADRQEFISELKKLYAQETTPSRLQVMTIHKSKGLEFDTVLLPSLGSQPNRGNRPLLRWLNLPTQEGENLLLMSPIQGAHQQQCPLYDYLGDLAQVKANYEAQRVLYVAVTRAKSRLYLLDSATKSSSYSFRHLLKKQEFIAVTAEEIPTDFAPSLPQLQKLPIDFILKERIKPMRSLNPLISGLTSSMSRLTGIVTHQMLQWICDHHPSNLAEIPWQLAHTAFKTLGFEKEIELHAVATMKEHLSRFFADSIGSWIIAPHAQEHNEYELLVSHHGQVVTRIIDRTFIDDSKLWIIDFKTGKEEEQTLEQYQQQLNQYAYCIANNTELPICCGLYFLASNHWVYWDYEVCLDQKNS